MPQSFYLSTQCERNTDGTLWRQTAQKDAGGDIAEFPKSSWPQNLAMTPLPAPNARPCHAKLWIASLGIAAFWDLITLILIQRLHRSFL